MLDFSKTELHSNLDLGAVNLGVYLDLVANSLLTKILLIKNSTFKRFRKFPKPQKPRFSSRKLAQSSFFELFGVTFPIEIVVFNQSQIGSLEFQLQTTPKRTFFSFRNFVT